MAVDQDRYRALVARAAFNASFYKGTWQDLSAAQRPMNPDGAPTWGRANGHPCLKQSAASVHVFSNAIASIVDTVAQPFWAEVLFDPSTADSVYLLSQANAGGWYLDWDAANARLSLRTMTAALGDARLCRAPIGSSPLGALCHAVLGVDPVALTAGAWVRGLPVVATFVNTAPPVLCANTQLRVCGVDGLAVQSLIARVWQGTPSNEDVTALAGQARLLVGGSW